MKAIRIDGESLNIDDHHLVHMEPGLFSGRVRVFVNGKWWMPLKPFPPGFIQQDSEFDTVENAAGALVLQFWGGNFPTIVSVDDEGEVTEKIGNRQAYIRWLKDELGQTVGLRTPYFAPRNP